jgi:hypothetical protein
LVYPNPASDNINFDLISTSETTATLSIFDIMGRMVYTQEHNIDFGTDLKTIKFNISSVNSTNGLYLYHLKVGTDLYHGKITIIHSFF